MFYDWDVRKVRYHPPYLAVMLLHCHCLYLELMDSFSFGGENADGFRAELEQKTRSGRYKKVRWFYRDVGFGNDLEGQFVRPWLWEWTERMFTGFASRLIPL